MANQCATPVRKPAFAPELVNPMKPSKRSTDTGAAELRTPSFKPLTREQCDSRAAEFQTPSFKPLTRERCVSQCPTTCPTGSTAFDLASPSPAGAGERGRDGEEDAAELDSLWALPEADMNFQTFEAFFLPTSSTSPAPLPISALPASRPSTPPVGVSAPGPLNAPPAAPRRAAQPDLLRALTWQSLKAVKEALAEDPGAASEPFWEQKCEPPICCAVRLGCSPAIVAELLSRGADVNAVDRHDSTPYMLLQELRTRGPLPGPAQHESDLVEALLLEAGAQTTESKTYVEEDTWGAADWAMPFDGPLGAFLPPPMPFADAVPPPMPLQY